MGKQWKQWLTFFWGGPPKSLQMVTAAMKLKDAYSLVENVLFNLYTSYSLINYFITSQFGRVHLFLLPYFLLSATFPGYMCVTKECYTSEDGLQSISG